MCVRSRGRALLVTLGGRAFYTVRKVRPSQPLGGRARARARVGLLPPPKGSN